MKLNKNDTIAYYVEKYAGRRNAVSHRPITESFIENTYNNYVKEIMDIFDGTILATNTVRATSGDNPIIVPAVMFETVSKSGIESHTGSGYYAVTVNGYTMREIMTFAYSQFVFDKDYQKEVMKYSHGIFSKNGNNGDGVKDYESLKAFLCDNDYETFENYLCATIGYREFNVVPDVAFAFHCLVCRETFDYNVSGPLEICDMVMHCVTNHCVPYGVMSDKNYELLSKKDKIIDMDDIINEYILCYDSYSKPECSCGKHECSCGVMHENNEHVCECDNKNCEKKEVEKDIVKPAEKPVEKPVEKDVEKPIENKKFSGTITISRNGKSDVYSTDNEKEFFDHLRDSKVDSYFNIWY